jgi:hypothetical protein
VLLGQCWVLVLGPGCWIYICFALLCSMHWMPLAFAKKMLLLLLLLGNLVCLKETSCSVGGFESGCLRVCPAVLYLDRRYPTYTR